MNKNKTIRDLNKPYCTTSKVIYRTIDEAARAVERGQLRPKAPSLNYYFCLLCLNYHLTSTLTRPKRQKKFT